MSANPPPSEHAWRLKMLLAWGEHEQAEKLLASLNAFNVAFGGVPYTMPEAFVGPMEGLITAPALTAIVERDLRFTMELQRKDAA